MPTPYGLDISPPTVDPWVSSSSPPSTTPQATFASALRHKHAGSTASTVGLRPTYRRRGSDSTIRKDEGHAYRSKERAPTAHGRSRTVDHRGERHPLVTGTSSSSSNMGITRPRLDRLLSGEAEDAIRRQHDKKVDTVATPERRGREEEKTVMVHQVQTSDTLSGVALKYNVSLAELRKANKLWSQDSIHLRKILYIPLDKSAQMKLLLPDLPEVQPPLSPSAITDETSDDQARPSSPKLPPSEIRRVPASELSFFPPPARSALRHAHSFSSSSHSSSDSWSNTLPRGFSPSVLTSNSSSSPFFTVTSGALTNGGGGGTATLSSLFNAIPRVPISLPRPLASRVSSESARLSSSPSASAISEDQEHELDNVTPSSRRPWALAPIAHPPTRSNAPPKSVDRSNTVRTAQPSPSPAMHVPRGSPTTTTPAPKGNLARRLAALSENTVR